MKWQPRNDIPHRRLYSQGSIFFCCQILHQKKSRCSLLQSILLRFSCCEFLINHRRFDHHWSWLPFWRDSLLSSILQSPCDLFHWRNATPSIRSWYLLPCRRGTLLTSTWQSPNDFEYRQSAMHCIHHYSLIPHRIDMFLINTSQSPNDY